MSSFKLAVASGKGGVGKTMLASSLVYLFAQEIKRQRKVVALDADVDAPNLHLWLGQDEDWAEEEKISTNFLPQIDKNKCDRCGECLKICHFEALSWGEDGYPAVNSFLCEGCRACEVVCPQKAIKMVAVNNANLRYQLVDNLLPNRQIPLYSAQLDPGRTGSGKIVDRLKEKANQEDFSLMIIDAPAGTGCPVIAALRGVDEVVLVTEPTPSSLSDLERILSVIRHFNLSFNIVINKWDINKSFTGKIEKKFASHLLGKVSYNKAVFQAISELKPIMQTDLPQKEEIRMIYRDLKQKVQND